MEREEQESQGVRVLLVRKMLGDTDRPGEAENREMFFSKITNAEMGFELVPCTYVYNPQVDLLTQARRVLETAQAEKAYWLEIDWSLLGEPIGQAFAQRLSVLAYIEGVEVLVRAQWKGDSIIGCFNGPRYYGGHEA